MVYTFGKYEKKLPLFATWQDGKLRWAIDAPNRLPMRVETYVAFQMFYEWPISDEQAGRFIGWFDEHGHIGKEAGSALLCKEGETIILHMPMHDGIAADDKVAKFAEDMAKGLSAEVFGGLPVDVRLCDRQLGTVKVATSR